MIKWLLLQLILTFYCIKNVNCASNCVKHRGYRPVFRKNAIFDYIPTSISYDIHTLRRKFGGDLPTAVYDMVEGYPITKLAIAYDNHTGK